MVETPSPRDTTRYIPTKGGRPHRCRSRPLPSNPGKPGRPARGKAVEFLRRYLTGIAMRSGGARPWTEIDLNRCFNSQGYSLSWGREIFRRLQLDHHFKNLCKVRFLQKRLKRNGCFIIMLAFRPYLRWDEEPLFYGADRKTSRHVRTALRAEDLELGHCPESNTSTKRTAEENNGTSSRRQSTGYAVVIGRDFDADLPAVAKKPEEGHSAPMRHSLNSGPPAEVIEAINSGAASPALNAKLIRENPCQSVSNPVRPISPGLRKFIVWLSFSLSELMTWTSKVPFSFPTVFNFVRRHALDGHEATAIQTAWKKAVEMTHSDAADSVGLPKNQSFCRKPIALCVAHATRILFRRDPRTAEKRRVDLFAARAKLKPILKPLEESRNSEKLVANE